MVELTTIGLVLQIRLRRLAKLGNATPKPEDSSAASSPKSAEPSPSKQDQTQQNKAPETSRRPINITPAAASTRDATSVNETAASSSSPLDDSSSKRTAATIDDRSQRKQQANKKPHLVQEESLPDWTDRVLSSIFRVTLDPERLEDAQGRKLIFLPSAASEVAESGSPARFTEDLLDSAILESATLRPHNTSLLKYFVACWKRITLALAQLKDGPPEKKKVLDEAKRLCMSYSLFSLTMPDLFGYVGSPYPCCCSLFGRVQ